MTNLEMNGGRIQQLAGSLLLVLLMQWSGHGRHQRRVLWTGGNLLPAHDLLNAGGIEARVSINEVGSLDIESVRYGRVE